MQKKISIIGCNKDALVLVGMRKTYLMILFNGDENNLEHFYVKKWNIRSICDGYGFKN